MNDVPIQSQTRGDHAAGDDTYEYDDIAYAEPGEVTSSGLGEDTAVERLASYDDVDLDSDPFADDLSDQLRAATPKKWSNRATLVMSVVALLAAGFLGGVLVQKHFGASSQADSRAALLSSLRNGRGGFGGEGGFGGSGFGGGTGTGGAATGTGGTGGGAGTTVGSATTGTIKLIDGTTIYVQLANGNIVTVKTNASTKVTVSKSSKLSSLKAGQLVTVNGPADSSGTVTATTVTGGN